MTILDRGYKILPAAQHITQTEPASISLMDMIETQLYNNTFKKTIGKCMRYANDIYMQLAIAN